MRGGFFFYRRGGRHGLFHMLWLILFPILMGLTAGWLASKADKGVRKLAKKAPAMPKTRKVWDWLNEEV